MTEDTGSRCSCRPTLLSDTSPRRLGSPGLDPARGTWLHPSAEPASTRRQQLLPRRCQHASSRPREPGPAVRAQLILKRTGRGGDRHPAARPEVGRHGESTRGAVQAHGLGGWAGPFPDLHTKGDSSTLTFPQAHTSHTGFTLLSIFVAKEKTYHDLCQIISNSFYKGGGAPRLGGSESSWPAEAPSLPPIIAQGAVGPMSPVSTSPLV